MRKSFVLLAAAIVASSLSACSGQPSAGPASSSAVMPQARSLAHRAVKPDNVSENFKIKNQATYTIKLVGQGGTCWSASPTPPSLVSGGTESSAITLTYNTSCGTTQTQYAIEYDKVIDPSGYFACEYNAIYDAATASIVFSAQGGVSATCTNSGGHPEIFTYGP
jgi:hypothetical protein